MYSFVDAGVSRLSLSLPRCMFNLLSRLFARCGSGTFTEDVGVFGEDFGPIVVVAEADDHVAEVFHRFGGRPVALGTLGVGVVRAIHVDGGTGISVVEEVWTGIGVGEESLGVRG